MYVQVSIVIVFIFTSVNMSVRMSDKTLSILIYYAIILMLVVCCRGNSQFQLNVGNGTGNQTFKLGRKMEMLDLCHMHGDGLQCDDKGVLFKLGH